MVLPQIPPSFVEPAGAQFFDIGDQPDQESGTHIADDTTLLPPTTEDTSRDHDDGQDLAVQSSSMPVGPVEQDTLDYGSGLRPPTAPEFTTPPLSPTHGPAQAPTLDDQSGIQYGPVQLSLEQHQFQAWTSTQSPTDLGRVLATLPDRLSPLAITGTPPNRVPGTPPSHERRSPYEQSSKRHSRLDDEVLILGRDEKGLRLVAIRESLLVGRAANKEVKFSKLSPKEKVLFKASMAKEWKDWCSFKATQELTRDELKSIGLDKPAKPGRRPPRVIGTRWVHTWKSIPDGFIAKSRLVVQGCQENSLDIRSDSPTGSRNSFMLTLAAAAQRGWTLESHDARTAFLQSEGIDRCLLTCQSAFYVAEGWPP